MRLPVAWLRDFVETPASSQEIANALTARGFVVDGIDVQPTPERIVVGSIESLLRHPNADKLQVSVVDVGSEKLQIVTGATNVAVGDRVPIALVGATVFERSESVNGRRPTKSIQRATLRGVESVGMMCSATELALPGEFDDGILIMESGAPVGADFWQAARYGDAVLDVDVPSNRADCLSVVGLAREAAAGLAVPMRAAEWGEAVGTHASPITVEIEDPTVCRRLLGQTFHGAANRRSPIWMTLRLHAAGVRSLSFLVDVSNYVQIETGQPLHFYDARKIRGSKIIARASRDRESLVTLDGVARTLDAGVPVIADAEGLIGIAGIFGGADAGVTAHTEDVFLESPNFVGARIRRASIALGLRTEGAIRHERNLPLDLTEFGRKRAANILLDAGASASAVVRAGEQPGTPRSLGVRPRRANALLGAAFSLEQMKASLTPIGIAADGSDPVNVTVPWWRPDLVEEVDIIEEVARGIGYGAIEERRGVAAPQSIDESTFRQERTLAYACAALGYSECITIALQGTRVVAAWERSGLPFWTPLATVVNPLSDEQRFLRPSLLPGLLGIATREWPRTGDALRLFEIGHVFRPLDAQAGEKPASHDGMYAENGVLEWPSLCGLVCLRDEAEAGAVDKSLLEVKGNTERLVGLFANRQLETVPHARPYLHPGAAGNLLLGSVTVAKFGRLHPRLSFAFELPQTTYAFMLYLENVPRERPVRAYVPLPRFPGTRRDIAVVVDEHVAAGALMQAARDLRTPNFEDVAAFDEYVGPQVESGKKSVALALMFRRTDGTITDAEADASMNAIVGVLKEKFGAVLRGPAQA